MAHAAETPSRCRRPQLDDVRIPRSRFLGPANASARIEQLLRGGRPFLVTRMGNAEQEVSFCFHTQNARARSTQSWQIDRNAGVYWTPSARGLTYAAMMRVYAAEFVRALELSDLVGTYNTPSSGNRSDAYEAALMTRYCMPRATCSAIEPRMLEPRFADRYHVTPWSAALAGKTVLVISPFEDSIRSQYARRRQVWRNATARMLPEFELKTVKTNMSAIGHRPHRDFLETLGVLQQAVKAAQPFDVALMGCGGYGLPLAAYIRGNLSRSAIYVGGGTQLMFGIWGSRWVGRPDVKAIANEFWVHPSKSEVPSNAKKLEGAAYF